VFDFFMWGGFVFCAIWHVISLLLLWEQLILRSDPESSDLLALGINVGLSGVSLCYFGMLAFK